MKQIYPDSLAMFKLGKTLCGRYSAEKQMYRLYYFYKQVTQGMVNQWKRLIMAYVLIFKSPDHYLGHSIGKIYVDETSLFSLRNALTYITEENNKWLHYP